MRNGSRIIGLACILGVMLPAQAAPNDAPQTAQLTNIRQAIDHAQKDLAAKQVAQKKAQEALARAKAALVQAQRELDAINRKQDAAWKQLQSLQANLTKLQADIGSTKAQVARLLAANYKNKQPPALALFLRNVDANQKSRYLTYTRHINEANDRVVKQLAQQQQELETQETLVNQQLEKLKKLAQQQQDKMRRLGVENSSAQSASRALNNDIASKRKKLNQLREDEQRLNQLVAQLAAKRAAERKSQSAAKTQSAKEKAQEAAKQLAQNKPRTEHKPALPMLDNVAPQNDRTSEFSRHQGRLPLPARGQVVGKFGMPRESGGTWYGLFIATAPTSVQSIAAGEVLYQTNMRGYGNTVLIDHGESYVSVYAGLSRVSVNAGQKVAMGQNIGTSGNLRDGEEGVYFEIRYRNRAINPNSWVR